MAFLRSKKKTSSAPSISGNAQADNITASNAQGPQSLHMSSSIANDSHDQKLADALRFLAIDAVQQANSGHPGMPMGMAEIASVLWQKHLRHHPLQPNWPNRDRFILSNGHGSMLLYGLLHLTGYDLPISELRNFRQMGSKTPGHPELGMTPGVETTTGPLGQGLSNAVGMALAERLLAAEFNREGHTLVDHYTYAFVGDGCLMEGISHEACSLAGTLNLSKLIVLYDDNGISIDGHVQHWFADDTAKRFTAYGWNTIHVDGHNLAALDSAISKAKQFAQADAGPTLILCRTQIGYGSPKMAGTADVHGSPLGKDEIAATRAALRWSAEPFVINEQIYAQWNATQIGQKEYDDWKNTLSSYTAAYPELAKELQRRLNKELPLDFTQRVQTLLSEVQEKNETIASRKASQNTLTQLVQWLPELLGGSADLTGSNLTDWKGAQAVRYQPAHDGHHGQFLAGRHINWGVREFGMSGALNGIALYSGYIPYGGTFLTFSDYSRNALRMAALMKIRSIFVFTHDSIGLGEDGPTHQPVEHTASLRLIPNMDVWRPADASETVVAWVAAIKRGTNGSVSGPSSLVFSRQNLPTLQRTPEQLQSIMRGGYVLRDWRRKDTQQPDIVIIATGSEVSLAVAACELLLKANIAPRVVSMPCTSVFDRQETAWQQQVLPSNIPRLIIEAGSSDGWYKYLHGLPSNKGAVLGMNTFGESAPGPQLQKHFGFTPENVVAQVQKLLA